MRLNELLEQRNITKYKLSKMSGLPFTTISEIANGKTKIKNCTGETLYKLAKAMDMSIEDLLAESMEKRPNFEIFKSNICHLVKDMGDIDFIIHTLESNQIQKLYNKKWEPECLYLLAMVDYLSRENDLPLCSEYNFLRSFRFEEPIYPEGILTMCAVFDSEQPKAESRKEAIPEFMRFNIVESEVRNVC